MIRGGLLSSSSDGGGLTWCRGGGCTGNGDGHGRVGGDGSTDDGGGGFRVGGYQRFNSGGDGSFAFGGQHGSLLVGIQGDAGILQGSQSSLVGQGITGSGQGDGQGDAGKGFAHIEHPH